MAGNNKGNNELWILVCDATLVVVLTHVVVLTRVVVAAWRRCKVYSEHTATISLIPLLSGRVCPPRSLPSSASSPSSIVKASNPVWQARPHRSGGPQFPPHCYLHVCARACVCVYACVCARVCMCVCMSVRACVCAYACERETGGREMARERACEFSKNVSK